MNRKVLTCLSAIAFLLAWNLPAAAQTEIVLHAKNASRVLGDWQAVSDASAAGGARMWNPDRGAAKLTTPYANPYDYFELTFNAEAGRAYRLWVRGQAERDYWGNDSLYVQFNGSLDSSGNAVSRIGTSEAETISIEDCSGCGVAKWGWSDNGWAAMGPLVYFATTGPQTLRIQKREDGVSVDQVVLSASTYLTSSPGAAKNDSTLLAASSSSSTTTAAPAASTTSASEIVIPVAASAAIRGNWQIVSDSTAAGGRRLWNPDNGAGKLTYPAPSPADYFDVTFNAEAGRGYRLWIRGQAQSDYWGNDSVFVQFSGSLNPSGGPAYRIGTTDATVVSIENCSGCGLSKWGWSDNGWDSLGDLIYFQTTGTQTLRVQRREDGISIDQIVLSASQYLTASPGQTKNDTTILGGGSGTTTTTTTTTPTTTTPTTTQPPPPPPPTGTGVRLRVMEWNIHHGVGTDGVYNIDRLATWMANVSPDVILLNEVEKYTSWGYEDQPARFKALLQAKTGRTWYAHFAQEFGQWWSNGKGHLILSAYPLDSVSYTTITASSGLNGAGAASQATIMVNGRTVNFILTHLDPYDQTMRLTQAIDATRWAAGYAENRIMAGDMNAWPDQSSIAEINTTYNDAWTVATNNGTATGISGITPFGATKKGRIDYIFFSKSAPNLVVINASTPDTRDASGYTPSDHRPVVVTFEVR
jgi:endonuclease/exonuclease/phosphatase family metal-dependent hydrolase